MSGRITDFWILAEAVQLGLDLVETRAIPKVHSLRNRLKVDSEYLGALFEIEVLATLQRSGMSPAIHGTPDFLVRTRNHQVQIEARHRGVPFSRAVAEALIGFMAT
jgi:hypothetical protein